MSSLWKYLGDWCELKPSGSLAQWVYLSLYLSPQSAQCGVARWRLGTITRTSAWLCQYLQSQLAPTPPQHNNNSQTIFWWHQYRTHHSDIVLCSTACTVWGWPCLASPRLSRKQSAAIKTKLCVNCAGGGIYQYWINGELPTVVKSCVDAGQTVVRVKCGPIITPLSAVRAGRCWHYR